MLQVKSETKKIAQGKLRLLGRKQRAVVSFDGSSFKILYAAPAASGKWPVRLLYAQSLKIQQGAKAAAKTLFAKYRCPLSRLGPVVMANPAHLSTALSLALPSRDPREIASMVEIQIEKKSPHGKEGSVSYYEVQGEAQKGYSRVLLVIAHHEVGEEMVSIIESMLMQPGRVTSELAGFSQYYRLLAQAVAPKQRALWLAKRRLMIDVDRDSTEVMAFQSDKLCFHRSIPIGAKSDVPVTVAETITKEERLIGELRRSLELMESEGFGVAFEEILLTGLTHRMTMLADKISQELFFKTVEVKSFNRAQFQGPAAGESHIAEEFSFTSLIGLASLPTTGGDLTPATLRLRQSFQDRTRALVILVSQILAGLILISGLLLTSVQRDMLRYGRLKAEEQRVGPEAKRVELLMDQLRIIKDRFDRKGELLKMLAEMGSRTPGAVHWNSMTYENGKRVAIKGVSVDSPQVFEMVNELEKAQVCIKPQARRVSKRKVEGTDVTEFEIVCPLIEEEGAEG
ncbi:MAG: PilN domain-containing protein [Candidatus Omnitrophica bacterium]|nr:PilN domain-containing protein [Candidatus Omnitrophota bacterium]